ncbi:MAG: molybdopterin-dependent oxidoreductase, partial [Coriobacteriaceae bacterium]|nr:molybdopterin-dependent oxidoreductase [Coriobacteriaceae bacterium]
YATTCYWGLDLGSISMGEEFLGEAPPGEGIINRMNRRTVNCADLGYQLTGSDDPEHNFASPKAKACYIFNANPSTSWPNGNLVREGMLQEDMFVVVHDIWVTDTADYADIILPATTLFECDDIHQSYHSLYLLMNNAILEPMGECKTNLETSQLLAKAMGYTDAAFDATFQEIVDTAFASGFSGYRGVTYDSLKKDNFIKVTYNTPYAAELKDGFGTPSGKIEFASDSMVEWGHATRVAEYVPDRESYDGDPELYARFPLSLISCNTKSMLNGNFHNMPDTRYTFGEPYVYLHPDDAAARGLAEGDSARIFNDRGDFTRTVRIEPGYVRAGTAVVLKSVWSKFDNGRQNANATTPSHIADFGYGASQQSNLVQIEKG